MDLITEAVRRGIIAFHQQANKAINNLALANNSW